MIEARSPDHHTPRDHAEDEGDDREMRIIRGELILDEWDVLVGQHDTGTRGNQRHFPVLVVFETPSFGAGEGDHVDHQRPDQGVLGGQRVAEPAEGQFTNAAVQIQREGDEQRTGQCG